MMPNSDSRVTIHMAASLDGFVARKDGRVDWLETSDEFADGETLDPAFVEAFLKTIRYRYNFLEDRGFMSSLFRNARNLVRG